MQSENELNRDDISLKEPKYSSKIQNAENIGLNFGYLYIQILRRTFLLCFLFIFVFFIKYLD